ncbi:MAG: hypothetical protein JW990_15000 [Thermoleophilia bacterium]|nr:hypothetical protein [Thermoleophilia bacterium]
MGRVCTVCAHEKRDDIDARIVCGDSSYKIAADYGVSAAAVQRHAKHHLSAALAAMQTQEQADRRATLLDRIESLIERAEAMFNEAAASGKFDQSLNALKELRLQLELLGKATGELNDRPQVTINLMQSPEWLEVRAVIFAALAGYPDARACVSGRLLELEAGES